MKTLITMICLSALLVLVPAFESHAEDYVPGDAAEPKDSSIDDEENGASSQQEAPEVQEDKFYRLPSGKWAHVRSGFFFGLNAGVGFVSPRPFETDSQSAFGGTMRTGFALSNEVLLSFDYTFWWGSSGEPDTGFHLTSVKGALTWFPRHDGFFVRGGFGRGYAEKVYSMWEANSREGKSYSLGLGHEWRPGRRLSLGLALDYTIIDIKEDPWPYQSQYKFANFTVQLNRY